MSRSNPTPTNPAKRFFSWKGDTGKLTYWDKEQSKEVEVKLPFTFLVLDQLATITGFCEADESNYWSNEVRSVAKEELTVRTSKGTKQVGLYKDLTEVRSHGAKYAKSIYIAFEEDGEFFIGNFKASGAALTSWIELSNKYATGNGKIVLTGAQEAKKGKVVYYTPVFEWTHSETLEDEKAVELDKELQIYLNQYLAAAQITQHSADPWPKDDDEEFASMLAKGLEADGIDSADIPFN